MSVLDGLRGSYSMFGVRGVLRSGANKLLGAPKEITAKPKSVRYPIYLRLRTSDVSLYKDLVLRTCYDVPLPFTPRAIVDAGANTGMATIFYANKYPDAKIIAIEPEPSNFAMLKKNCAPYPNIIPVNAALWDRDCQLRLGPTGLDSAEYGKWAFHVTDKGIPVRGVTMGTIMRETGISAVDLIKMDIEGGEIEAFANCLGLDEAGQSRGDRTS